MKNKVKLLLAFILGIAVTSGVVYASNLLASDVAYDNTQSGLTATNVQSALDELNTKANTWIDPSYIDFGTLATNTAKTVLASSKGVCIKRNNKVSCFKVNNWAEEQNHIQQVFSDISCYVDSSIVSCSASDFTCGVYSDGFVDCDDDSGSSYCTVNSGGTVKCH
jgi:hypothetical protein